MRMRKSKAKVDAQRWVDAADQMSSANAKKPMVVEQLPSGAIMGRGTSAKNVGSKGSAARKMSKQMPPKERPIMGPGFPGGPPISGIGRPKPRPIGPPRDRVPVPKPPPIYGDNFPNRPTKMSKSQGAYINGKPASADLTKAMRPRKKG